MSSNPSSSSSTPGSFVDESIECAICYDPLEAKPIVTLHCGHKWHLECIVQQIKIGSMTASNDDKRLLFNGCQCGKCGSIFGEVDHPDLPKDLIRSTDKLRSKVNALIDEHNLLEGLPPTGVVLSNHSDGSGKQPQRVDLYKEARRKYAFYLCSHCKDPYFGGTIECADEVRSPAASSSSGEGAARGLPEPRLCPACAPQSQTICRNPSEHGRYLIWKCRYCCKPSTTVCYGNVHFCDDCHAKNSIANSVGGPFVEALPCPGNSCGYPKPSEGSDRNSVNNNNRSSSQHHRSGFHSNGPSQDCEQVYSCVLCDSTGGTANDANSSNSHHDPLAIEAGSRNFVVNPSGEEGLKGWQQLNPRKSWEVELQEDHEDQMIPPLLQTPVLRRNHEEGNHHRPPITTNFVSSFMDCAMQQTVDLSEVLRLGNNNNEGRPPGVVRIEVSARYTGRTDCPSVFALQAILSDGNPAAQRRRNTNNNNHQRRMSSGTLEAPPGVYWERTSLEFVVDTTQMEWNRPMVTVAVFGKDMRCWRGNYGSKVADVTIRVVGGTLEEIDALVKPPEEVHGSLGEIGGGEDNNTSEAARENDGGVPSATDRSRSGTSTPPRTKPALLWMLEAAVVSGVLLSWLFSKYRESNPEANDKDIIRGK